MRSHQRRGDATPLRRPPSRAATTATAASVIVVACAGLRSAHAFSFVPSLRRFEPPRTTVTAAAVGTSLLVSAPGLMPLSGMYRSLPSPFSSTAPRRSTMTMKRPNKKRRATMNVPTTVEDPGEGVPANLKRKVAAKRPALGHVVPKNSFTRRHSSTEGGDGRRPLAGGGGGARLRPQGADRDAGRYNNPSNLKILGGSSRGRKLESPDVYLRPMMGKVREAVYSTLTSFGLYGDRTATRHLDIFSGSGSVGLESLSRGARHCTFVDMSSDCCATCERNVVRCGFDDDDGGSLGDGGGGATAPTNIDGPTTRVVCADAFRALRRPDTVGIPSGETYQIVTLCPPYEEIVYADLIDAVANSPLVTDDTVVMIEYPIELGCMPHVIAREDGGALVGTRNRKYGRTVIAMYVVNPSGNMEVADSRPEEFITI